MRWPTSPPRHGAFAVTPRPAVPPACRYLPPTAIFLAFLTFSACAASSSDSGTASPGGTGSGGSTASGSGGGVSNPPGAGWGSGGSVGSGGPPPGGVGSGGTASGAGGSASAGTGGIGCAITLIPVSPASLDNLTAGSDARVRFHATVSGGTRAAKWMWTVLFLTKDSVSVPVSITPTDDPSIIEFPITTAGGYIVHVFADVGLNCGLEGFLTVKDPQPNAVIFSVSPPDSLVGTFPSQRLTVAVKAANASPIALALRPGTPIRILPQDAGGQTLPSFVRVRALSGASSIDGYTDRGPVSAVLLPWPAETYEVLVVPDARVAPQLFGTSDLIAAGDQLVTLAMSPGIRITGTALDSSGSPVSDTRVVLRAGTRPSTVGATDDSGAFLLWTRAGVHSAVFSPPPGSGLPEAHLATNPGVSVSTADSAVTMDLKWARFTMAPVNLHIRSSDGLSDIAGAGVSIESQAELPNVGTISMNGSSGGASMVTAAGAVRARATSDPSGMARFATVPLGSYTVSILAPQGSMATRVSLVVAAGGVSRSIPLATPVALSGRLLPVAQTTGIRVLARDQSPGAETATIATATVDSMGHYQLTVAPGRSYQLEADPSGVAGFARTVLGTVDAAAQDTGAPDFTVEVGVVFNGAVTGATPSGPYPGVAGAVVQAFCPGLSATCLAPGRPIAEAVTRSDGTFRLVLPSSLVH